MLKNRRKIPWREAFPREIYAKFPQGWMARFIDPEVIEAAMPDVEIADFLTGDELKRRLDALDRMGGVPEAALSASNSPLSIMPGGKLYPMIVRDRAAARQHVERLTFKPPLPKA